MFAVASPPVSRAWAQVRAAWAEFPVKVGLIGTCIVAIGSLTPAYLPQASPLWPVLRSAGMDGQLGRILGTILTVSGVFLLLDAWFRLRHQVYAELRPLAIIGIWSLPFLIAPPIFSHDIYSYGAQGWMIHNGQNPYDGGPGLVPGPFTDYTPWVWRYSAAPYGPLALQISRLMAELSGGQPWLAAGLLRIPALIGVVCIVELLPRLGRAVGADIRQIHWFGCLNPLLVIDYVGGGHNDAWMMGLVAVGLWLATRPRWWPLAAVLIGVAASIKQPAILAALFLPLLTLPFDSWRSKQALVAVGRSLASLAIAVVAFILISWACGLGFGWIEAMTVPGSSASFSPSYIIGSLLQQLDPGSQWSTLVTRIALGIGVLVIAFAILRFGPQRPMKALSWSWIAAAVCAPALRPWYLLWGFLLLPFSSSKRVVPWPAVLTVIALLCYSAINLGDRNGFFAIIAAIVCTAVWVAHIVIYHRLWQNIKRHK